MQGSVPKIDLSENHLSFRCASTVKEICQPFFAKMDLRHFYYAWFDQTHQQVAVLTTTPECNRYFFSHNLVPQGQDLTPGWHYLPVNRYSRERVQTNRQFNLDQTIDWVMEVDDGIEMFGFSTVCGQKDKTNFYFNHLEDLQHFGAEFKERAQAMIHQAKQNAIVLSAKAVLPEHNKNLSMREEEVLQFLAQGFNARETAIHLNLSPRTVEYYLENIKNKLGLHRKTELVRFSLGYSPI